MALYTYSSQEVAINYKGAPITGLAKGTFVDIEYDEEDWMYETGSDGNVTRSLKPNKTATATITLQQSSPSNDILSGFRSLDRATGLGTGVFMVKDLRGTSLVAVPTAFIAKPAKVTFSDELETREWKFILTGGVYHVGSNIPNIPGVA